MTWQFSEKKTNFLRKNDFLKKRDSREREIDFSWFSQEKNGFPVIFLLLTISENFDYTWKHWQLMTTLTVSDEFSILTIFDNFDDFWLVVFQTLITIMTIENLNSWQSLLPGNQEWHWWTAFTILVMFSPRLLATYPTSPNEKIPFNMGMTGLPCKKHQRSFFQWFLYGCPWRT